MVALITLIFILFDIGTAQEIKNDESLLSLIATVLDCEEISNISIDTIMKTILSDSTELAIVAFFDETTTMAQRTKLFYLIMKTNEHYFVQPIAQERPATAVFWEQIKVSGTFHKTNAPYKGIYIISVTDSMVSIVESVKSLVEYSVKKDEIFFGLDNVKGIVKLTDPIPVFIKNISHNGKITQSILEYNLVGDTIIQFVSVKGFPSTVQESFLKRKYISLNLFNNNKSSQKGIDIKAIHTKVFEFFNKGQKEKARDTILANIGNLNNIEIDDRNVIYLNDLGYVMEQTSRFREAVSILEKVTSKFPTRTVAWLNLGDAQAGLGKIEEAKESYQRYIELMESSGKGKKVPERVRTFLQSK